MMAGEKKPLVTAAVMTEFGPVLEDPSFLDPHGASGDLTWTPGWSELRRQRDLAHAEYVKTYSRQPTAKDLPTLPGQLVLARRSKPMSGLPDNTDVLTFGQEGFRVVTKDDIGKAWFCPDRKLPVGSEILADGTVVKGDAVYMWADAGSAAKRAARRTQHTQDLVDSRAKVALEEEGRRHKGSDAYVEKLK